MNRAAQTIAVTTAFILLGGCGSSTAHRPPITATAATTASAVTPTTTEIAAAGDATTTTTPLPQKLLDDLRGFCTQHWPVMEVFSHVSDESDQHILTGAQVAQAVTLYKSMLTRSSCS